MGKSFPTHDVLLQPAAQHNYVCSLKLLKKLVHVPTTLTTGDLSMPIGEDCYNFTLEKRKQSTS